MALPLALHGERSRRWRDGCERFGCGMGLAEYPKRFHELSAVAGEAGLPYPSDLQHL